jgi:hypothetical protein
MALRLNIECSGERHTLILNQDGTVTSDPDIHDEELEAGLVELGAPEPDCFRMARQFRNHPTDIVECVMNVDPDTGETIDPWWHGDPQPRMLPRTYGIGDYLVQWIRLDFVEHILWIFDRKEDRDFLAAAIEHAKNKPPQTDRPPWTPHTDRPLYSGLGALVARYDGSSVVPGAFTRSSQGRKTTMWMAAIAFRDAITPILSHFGRSTDQSSFQRAAMAVAFMATPEGRDLNIPEGERYETFITSRPEVFEAFAKERQWQLAHIHKVLTDLKAGKKVYPHWNWSPAR